MAEASISEDQFSCPVCLDILKDPVTIPCGHSYCMSCITDCWDQDTLKGVYSCPLCKHIFSPRPVVGKNVVFAEMLEKLKKTKLQATVAGQCYAGPGDVECNVCTGRKYKAVKSCLVCLKSYCETHFKRHEKFHPGKRHKVINASGRLQEMICLKHNKKLDIYCRTDQQSVCDLCMMDEHKYHESVSVSAERTEKQKQLKGIHRDLRQIIQEREKDVEDLKEAVKSHKHSAQTAVEDSDRIFTELMRSIERSRSEVKQLIRDQEKAAVSEAEGLLKQLEQKIADLKRRDAELEQLSHTDDHIHFLKCLSVAESTDIPSITLTNLISFDDLRMSLSQLRKKLEDLCKGKIKKISDRVKCIQTIPFHDPKTREEFLQYSHQLTLDLNTLNGLLYLSDENREISQGDTFYHYPDHPDRFDYWEQVLCRESVCGRCYWEVELDGSSTVEIAVSYKNISRKREHLRTDCLFGCNNLSWSLCCSSDRHTFSYNNIKTELPVVCSSCRIGVYVDHGAGILSFYSVSDKMILIHRVQTTFTQPLYPGFRVYWGSMMKLCDLTP
ncbi:tripartite motif-containing protein 16-like protein [Xyrauchen texanus]|uniref:tripartite motif-containing protein 16-like protein n=1 Tax=Xyrauchen texanus TaxID=154827 RepID=UPI002241F8C5|nr:tripartite motif-containing protein 16-like protein [Xyrauchen texanus]XP_051983860.1 tripartite motif-containing protein 16-like protein [Xyrauchen texanus]XP_051983861.1 tripartite motif-containing protein 16-like protein [Xyrauchen texanus]XP_051983862.1 tripartite motif-containing protein 16-like protein [Xyrauchen texanus]XP_051983863.1 tripartite motif-containing protein 16-like protein [Xyrauchen texanus]